MSVIDGKGVNNAGSVTAENQDDACVCSSENEPEAAGSRRRVTFQDEEIGGTSDDGDAVKEANFRPMEVLDVILSVSSAEDQEECDETAA